MSRVRFFIVSAVLCVAGFVSQGAVAQNAAEEHVLRQLRCDSLPTPTPIVAWLARERYLRLPERMGYDSISCWQLERSFSVAGLDFDGICVADDDPLVRELYPDVYWRGPGTSPGTLISLQTRANARLLESWARGNGLDGARLGTSDMFDMRAIECTSWDVR